MNQKEKIYAGLARETIGAITSNIKNWKGFLSTMARNYDYTYPEQIMIYAQKPEAMLCKTYDEWMSKDFLRYVKRGSKGIALFVTDEDTPYLRYVFDISDTGTRKVSPKLNLWEVNRENRDHIMDIMGKSFGVEAKGVWDIQLESVAAKLAEEYWQNYQKAVIDIVDGSLLEEYDELNIEVVFKEVVANSVSYAIYSRITHNPEDYFEHEDFLKFYDFNTRKTINALGTAVNQISGMIFKELERAISEFNKTRETERSDSYDKSDDLQQEWGLFDSEPETCQHRTEITGQVWENEESLPRGKQSDTVERTDFGRETLSSPMGSTGDSNSDNGTNDDRPVEEKSTTGQENKSDGMGTAHEQPESHSRRSDNDGTDIQLSFFMGEQEQIDLIEKAESTTSAFSFSQDEIDKILQVGSNTDYGRMIIASEYMKIKPSDEIIDAIKSVYHGGFGMKTERGDISVWYSEKGMELAMGNYAQNHKRAYILSWEDVARRIGTLLDEGKFASNVELVEAIPHERYELSKNMLYLMQDLSDDAKDIYLNSLNEIRKSGSFQENATTISNLLKDKDFRGTLKSELEKLSEDYRENPNIIRFHFHKIDLILKKLNDLDLPLMFYNTNMIDVKPVKSFITDDEINASLTVGSSMQGGKERIYNYWQEKHDKYQKADFLKTEYGIGGRSHAVSQTSGSYEDHDSKGISYKKDGCEIVNLTWQQVASRIDKLISQKKYLIKKDDNTIAEPKQSDSSYEKYSEVKKNNPDDIVLFQNGDFFENYGEDAEIAASELDLNLTHKTVDNNLIPMCGFPSNKLDVYLEKLRQNHSVVLSAIPEQSTERQEFKMSVLGKAFEEPKEFSEENPKYNIGDTVYLENTAFIIEKIRNYEVVMRDPNLTYPIFRVENKENFNEMLKRDERNSAFLNSDNQQSEVLSETENQKEIPPVNFQITDEHLGEGGPKVKFRANMNAITLLKELELDGNRNATPEEQEILSKYVGWGGLADAFDERKDNWSNEYRELCATLHPDEYASARASTLNAHYTSPTVISAIYNAVENMGFESGNILEPSMGIGNFFGMLPDTMRNSRLYGIELDPISGKIAQKLYPKAEIKVTGFEQTNRRDFYDLAIGNVPFGNYKVSDKPYNKLGFSIHNYFLAKALDQIRPGGIIAFVTSHYTMDSKNTDARRYIAQRAELLGAIRLPNNAFLNNAGAEVVSDIIFLQKRENPIEIEPDWVNLGETEDGFILNSYFLDNPQMILGNLTVHSTPYGKEELTVTPLENKDLSVLLQEAIKNIKGEYKPLEFEKIYEPTKSCETVPADPNVKNFSYTVVNDEVYFRENSIMRKAELSETATGRIKGMVKLRNIVDDLINYQLEDYSDNEIKEKQNELNSVYDSFTNEFGLINSRANNQAFSEDSSYYLLCSLENIDENGNLESKADMFTKRTIKPERQIKNVDTPAEALAVSIGEQGKINLPYMAELLETPNQYDEIIEGLRGVIFKDPMAESSKEKGWLTADEYLSGNVRNKLKIAQMAAENDDSFKINVEYLLKSQPKELEASDIDVRLGATWIDIEYIQNFMEETFELPYYLRNSIEVKFAPLTAEWQITGKSYVSKNDVYAYMTYGTSRANAYRILEDTLNLRDVRIYDTIDDGDGKQKRVLNKKETTLAQQKQQAIKDSFRDWIWKDPYRRETLVKKYNELFNSTRPREYDGSHITFGGMNPEIKLREHQQNAIAHILYGGNTLLAHEVGAGKTFEMAAAAMESKRLGLCQKSLFVVPNHLTLQWANEFLRLYPSAKLLVANKKDFETANRKKFCGRIATGDYDAIIIGHSQFEKIPVSPERQENILNNQIEEIENAIVEMKHQRGENFTIKQMEKTKKSLQTRLEKLRAEDRKDDVITFEQLGVDRLFVDEAHMFKNLFLYTKMRNVAGLSTSEAQKSSDMFMKCQYMDELTGGRGIVFATGTPVSNSMTELYTMMRYLQYSTLQQKNLTHFDCWASTFGETTTAIELAPEGTGYRARTRFAKFFNLPELMNMFKEVADIKTSDQLNLPVPEAKFETVVVQPSEFQKEMVASLSDRAALVHTGTVDPSVDNMLKITSDGRKLGLDQRLINPLLPDDPNSKLNACVNNVMRIYEEGNEKKLTQLLFCDLSTPKNDGSFNVYSDIKTKLIEKGVPENEVAFIHDADSEAKKKELFTKVRSGQVRVLLGSTQKMGAGTNCQDKLIAVHHLDVGWRPADMTQRNGRIIRQGNQNKEVQIYQYVTEGTFDAYLYQTLENKQKFISQIMTSKSPVRSCDDVDEQALSYAEIKALCAGDPNIKEKMDLDVEVARLKVLKADHLSQQYRLEDKLLKYFPAEIESQHSLINGLKKDIEIVKANPIPEEGFIGMTIMGKHYTEKADAGEAILSACKVVNSTNSLTLGEYRGFSMEIFFESFSKEYQVALKGEITHRATLGSSTLGNLTRIDNVLSSIPERLERAEQKLNTLNDQKESSKLELGKPFPQEKELAEKTARLAELDALLNMDERTSDKEVEDEKPSVLEDLKTRAEKIPPVSYGHDEAEL